MLHSFHFLRPWWLLALLIVAGLVWRLWRDDLQLQTWAAVCDKHLLAHLLQKKGSSKRGMAWLLLLLSGLLLVFSLAGPSWTRLPVPSYYAIEPRVLVLDMSENMLMNDLTPDRLTRAKFKLRDVFDHKTAGQFGLVVFTGEPFVVSPLTDDSNTIAALLETLTPDIMPVGGEKLDDALEEGAKLITQAGFTQGQLLVLSATPPDTAAINTAKKLSTTGIVTSIMPVVADKTTTAFFQPLANAGGGVLIPFADTSNDLEQWLKKTNDTQQLKRSEQNDFPLWRDEGRWFLIPALILLLPVFWRGWLQRIES